MGSVVAPSAQPMASRHLPAAKRPCCGSGEPRSPSQIPSRRRTAIPKGVELVIFIGLQGAGKSTFYRERFAATHAYVSLDRLRNTPSRPRQRQTELVAMALAAGQSVVVDNTSPTPA